MIVNEWNCSEVPLASRRSFCTSVADVKCLERLLFFKT